MTMNPEFWLWLAAFGMAAIGVAGTVLPALPGPPLVFAALLLAAWIDDFQRVGYLSLALLSALTLLTLMVDLAAGYVGAKRVGASRLALVGAAVGTLVGIFLGIPGIIFGPFAGALLGELIARGDALRAGRVAFATWLGMLIAVIVKLAVVFTMLGWFLLAYLF